MPDPTRNANGEFVRDDTAIAGALVESLRLLSRAVDIFDLAATNATGRIAAVDALKRDIDELVDAAGEIDRRNGQGIEVGR
jgi:hypothetical protein